MSSFRIHDPATAPSGARAILEGTHKALGFVPNLYGLLAGSPATLEAYTTLARIQEKSGAFDETERQVLFLSISAHNGCEYCVAAHSTIAGMKKVPADVVQALRDGAPLPTPRLEALRTFATRLVEARGWVSPAELSAFRAAGYDERAVLEVILAVAFKTISNWANHVAGTPLDAAFQPQAWKAVALAS